MEKSKYVYSHLNDMSVEMQTQEQRNMTLLRGKALLNEEESRLTFIQNPPRGERSSEVGRTRHGRMVRRPDGKYTLTLRFEVGEKYLGETLIAEVRNQVKMAKEDEELMKKEAQRKAIKKRKEVDK